MQACLHTHARTLWHWGLSYFTYIRRVLYISGKAVCRLFCTHKLELCHTLLVTVPLKKKVAAHTYQDFVTLSLDTVLSTCFRRRLLTFLAFTQFKYLFCTHILGLCGIGFS
jgi:hypothetical protein